MAIAICTETMPRLKSARMNLVVVSSLNITENSVSGKIHHIGVLLLERFFLNCPDNTMRKIFSNVVYFKCVKI